jgi:hypothetical protein
VRPPPRNITYKLRNLTAAIDGSAGNRLTVPLMSGTVAVAHEFTEDLPDACPPEDAVQASYENVWRFVSSNPPADVDFHSHAMLDKPLPRFGVTLCEWSSCSLFLSDNDSYKLLPKPKKKFKFIARLQITNLCGFTQSNGKHVHFWRFKNVTPKVTAVFPL